MSKKFWVIVSIWVLFLVVGTVLFVCYSLKLLFQPPTLTEISDPKEYGNYSGTLNDGFTNQFIKSFFPQKLEPYFSDITYSYKAEDLDNYGFEAYLEFKIENEEVFDQYIASLGTEACWKPFRYDSDFMEYSLQNELLAYQSSEYYEEGLRYSIRIAHIRKILYSEKDNTVIFVAIGVNNGGFADNFFLDAFITRFGIDLAEYQENIEGQNY